MSIKQKVGEFISTFIEFLIKTFRAAENGKASIMELGNGGKMKDHVMIIMNK